MEISQSDALSVEENWKKLSLTAPGVFQDEAGGRFGFQTLWIILCLSKKVCTVAKWENSLMLLRLNRCAGFCDGLMWQVNDESGLFLTLLGFCSYLNAMALFHCIPKCNFTPLDKYSKIKWWRRFELFVSHLGNILSEPRETLFCYDLLHPSIREASSMKPLMIKIHFCCLHRCNFRLLPALCCRHFLISQRKSRWLEHFSSYLNVKWVYLTSSSLSSCMYH